MITPKITATLNFTCQSEIIHCTKITQINGYLQVFLRVKLSNQYTQLVLISECVSLIAYSDFSEEQIILQI